MEQFIHFVINHWALWIAMIVLLLLLLRVETGANIGGLQLLTPQVATQKVNRENAVILDVREETAFANGHILGAINIPLKQLSEQIKKLKKYKDKPVIVCLASGQSFGKAGQALKAEGFSQLFALKGGIDAWQQANLPLMKAETQTS